MLFRSVKEYSGKEIRDIRTKAGMTQSVFASYMGGSIKTVEADVYKRQGLRDGGGQVV